MGEMLKRSGWRRESLIVSTKLFWGEPESGPTSPNDRGSTTLSLRIDDFVTNGVFAGLSRKHIIEGYFMNDFTRYLN